MLFSIIIPVYNLEDYLKGCILSIYSQNFDASSFEVLAINDGSTDASGAILDQLAAEYGNMKLFHKENGGVSSARNVGLNNSKGDYILFLDGDDEFMPGAFSELEIVLKNNFVDMIVMDSLVMRENGDLQSVYPLSSKLSGSEWKGTDLVQIFTRGSACGVAFSSKLINKHSIRFNENISIGEDSLFYAEVAMYAEKVELHPIPFYLVNKRVGSASNTLTREKVLRFNYTLIVIKKMIDNPRLMKDQKAVLSSLAFRLISGTMMLFLINTGWGSIKENAQLVKETKILPLDLRGIKKYRHNIIILNLSYKLYFYYLKIVRRLKS